MIVIPGPSSDRLGRRVAELLKADVVDVQYKLFADGESYVRLAGDVAGNDIVIVHSCDPPQDKRWMELFFLVSTARELGAEKIITVVPYYGYSRQDRRILPGEAIGSEVIVRLLESAGIDLFMTFDMHNENILSRFKVEAKNLSAMPSIGKYVQQLNLKNPFVVTPDDEAPERAKTVAEILSGEWDYFGKVRDPRTGEIFTQAKELPVEGRDVVIVDDIISTGGTMLNATKAVKDQGARDVYLACTFPLLKEESAERLMNAGAKAIYGTDCVVTKYSVISVAPAIAEALRSLALF